MAKIQIDPQFEKWVREKVVKNFELKKIKVTPTAQVGLAYLMQAQLEEYTSLTPEQVLAGAEKLLGLILRAYPVKYQKAPLTINRALHLITEANTFMLEFPWGTTMEQTAITPEGTVVERELGKEGQH